jgi:ABC-type sugar transport system ATPase subunit
MLDRFRPRPESMTQPLIEFRGVSKAYPGVQALRDFSLSVHPGEIVGLVGENGAGKSTLIRVASGVQAPDRGTIAWLGRDRRFYAPRDAIEAGIATIHQELVDFPHLSVAENLLLGERWPRHWWGGVDWRRLEAKARVLLGDFDLAIDPLAPLGSLRSAEKQEVAIARALAARARLLILDEPTANLTADEVDRVHRRVRAIRASGGSVLYVSHHLEEILSLSDRVAVLRDGELVSVRETSSATIDLLVRDMVGRSIATTPRRDSGVTTSSEVALELELAGVRGLFRDVTLRVRRGEIVGLAGLIGAGRSELARAIFGLYPLDTGSMRLQGRPWSPRHPREALELGLVYLPEERKRQGFVLDHSVSDSVSVGFTDLIARAFGIPPRIERERVESAIARWDVRSSSRHQAIGKLSGGNQQKAMLARWLERRPSVLIADEPTRGVDVGAKDEIHRRIEELAAAGLAVLVISSDLPEILRLADRVIVLRGGVVGAELERREATEEAILRAAAGVPAEARTGLGGRTT